MSFIHNRMGVVTLAVAATVLLLGAGCQKPQENRPPILDQGPSTLPGAANDASGSLPTEWAEYRSESLGIAIPYPEGWYVEEQSDGSTDFFENAPPASGDAPSQMWVLQRESSSIDAAIQAEFPTVYEREEVTRSGITMTRIVYPYDVRLDPDKRMVAYMWMSTNAVRMVGGAENDVNLEYAVDHLEVDDE